MDHSVAPVSNDESAQKGMMERYGITWTHVIIALVVIALIYYFMFHKKSSSSDGLSDIASSYTFKRE